MREDLSWAAFLLMCFALVGLTGIFGSYGPQIPLERALARLATLDKVDALATAPGGTAVPDTLRGQLGPLAETVLDGPGELTSRLATARNTVQNEATREAASVAGRIRLMVLSVTILAGLFGAGVMLFALKQTRRRLPGTGG